MDNNILDYRSPSQAPSPLWSNLLRKFMLGPVTGAGVGIVQTSALVFCWLYHGQPQQWFFRLGWQSVDSTYFLFSIGGGIIGIFYGSALMMFERMAGRRIRAMLSIPITLLLAFVVSGIMYEVEFQHQTIWVFAEQLTAMALGLLVSVMFSLRVSQ